MQGSHGFYLNKTRDLNQKKRKSWQFREWVGLKQSSFQMMPCMAPVLVYLVIDG